MNRLTPHALTPRVKFYMSNHDSYILILRHNRFCSEIWEDVLYMSRRVTSAAPCASLEPDRSSGVSETFGATLGLHGWRSGLSLFIPI